jgi:hypothetical protein
MNKKRIIPIGNLDIINENLILLHYKNVFNIETQIKRKGEKLWA